MPVDFLIAPTEEILCLRRAAICNGAILERCCDRRNVIPTFDQALVFAPLSAVAIGGIEAENAGSASALFNMMCNLGGAIGIAVLQTLPTKREQYYSNVLTQSVPIVRPMPIFGRIGPGMRSAGH